MSSPVSQRPLVTHLPFRRMSLPTAPNLNLNRQSVVSLASFESLPEHGTLQSPIASPTKKMKSRRTSIETHRKGLRRRSHQAPDKERRAKRCNVIQEFYETERTYVQGLDLIYEVSCASPNAVAAVFVDYCGSNSYFLRPLSLYSILLILSLTARTSPPCSPTSLTFGIFIAHFFLLSTNTFIPTLTLNPSHSYSQVLHHICPLFSCRIFRTCLCTHHLLPHSAHHWQL